MARNHTPAAARRPVAPDFRMTAAVKAELREMQRAAAERKSAPPGQALDEYPWAASWPAFMAKLRTEAGAREVAAIQNAAGLTERTGAGGAFLVPYGLSSQVFAYMSQAAIWPRATVLDMDEYRVGLPVLDNAAQSSTGALGGITFQLTADGETIAPSNPQFGEAWLESQKLAALISPVPDELADDAAAAFSDLFSRVVGMGLAWETDDLFFNGSGVAEPEGLLTCPAAVAVTRVTPGQPPVAADVVALAKALHPASKASATWLMSEDVFDALLDLYLAIGSPTNAAAPPSEWLKFCPELGYWTLLGIPAAVTDHQPPAGTAGDLALCDLSLYVIGTREMMTIERSSKGSTFPNAASAWRIRTRLDGRYLARSSYVLPNGKTVSPLAVLH